MKLQDFMDNKVAGDLEYVMPDACAGDVVLEHKKELHLREVNANEYYCNNSEDTLQSPVKTPDQHHDESGESDGIEDSDGAESVICKDSCDTQVGVNSQLNSNTSSPEIEDDHVSSPLVSTDELDKEISEIKAKINALDDIADSGDHSNVSDVAASVKYDSDTNETSDSPVRTLVQIRQSLEEKVKHLREEKTVSDEKIRLAKEEEELRVQEKIKLRQQLLIHRKERLKKVISDLKHKLDCQSHRLQSGYSSLLALQKTIFRSRSFSSKSRPTKCAARDTAEAPF